ncbi:hypothetical protein ACTXT7_016565 [Hymenolepis weldensis]
MEQRELHPSLINIVDSELSMTFDYPHTTSHLHAWRMEISKEPQNDKYDARRELKGSIDHK